MTETELLDLIGPYRGPCGLCGGPDARHRTLDTIRDRLWAGEDAQSVAEDYVMDVAVVEKIAATA